MTPASHRLASILVAVLLTPPAFGQFSSTSGLSVPSSVVSTKGVNTSVEASANASAFSVVASRMSQGAVWSEVMSELSGPRSLASAPLLLSFIGAEASSDSSEPSLSDLRLALGVKPGGSCALRPNPEIGEKLWRSLLLILETDQIHVARWLRDEFPKARDAVPIEAPGPSTLEALATVTRLASRPENHRVLTALSRRLFQCKGTREEASLRGAAALVFLNAAAEDESEIPEQPVRLIVYGPGFASPPPAEPTRQERLEAMIRARRDRIREQESLGLTKDRLHEEERPHLCLAMSGGGVRSAAFQLGVLQGLAELTLRDGDAEIALLDELDIASAVSGGSYALAWLLSQKEPKAALAAKSLDTSDARKAWLTNHLEGAFGGLGSVATHALRLTTRLERTALPDPSLAHFFYARLLRASFGLDPRPVADLGSSGTPWPIFVTTARLGEEGACGNPPPAGIFLGEASRLRRSVFEITPHAGGSRELGFSARLPRDLTVPMAVATAGAALDDPHHDYCNALRGLGVTLGTRVGRWQPEPAPAGDVPAGPLHLSDGGFSDNLGLYPLLRRSCKTILVADGSYDPDLMFTDYRRLERVLRDEGIELQNEALTDLAAKQGVDCDAASTPPCFVRRSPAALASPFAARRTDQATFEGEIRMPDEGGMTIPFAVIKLAIDETNPGQYPLPIQTLLASEDNGSFPHIPTSRQKLTAEEFRALRLLGCHLVQTIYAEDFEIPDDSPCRAPATTETQP